MVKIGILFGGISTEHEISIITAYQVKEKMKSYYDICMLYISKKGILFDASKMSINDFKDNNHKKLKKASWIIGGIKKIKTIKIDSVVIAMHGINGEDGLGASILDYYQIPYVGVNPFYSALFMDKNKTHELLNHLNIKCTKSIKYTLNDYLIKKKVMNFPIIIKPANLGSSIGISIVKKQEELDAALAKAFVYDNELIIEEYIENFCEYTVSVSGMGCSNIEIVKANSPFLSFENKYEDAFKTIHKLAIINDSIATEAANIASNLYKKLNLSGIIRMDFIYGNNTLYLNEVNTIPGALANYLYDNFEEVLINEIKTSFFNYKKIHELVTSYDINILNVSNFEK